MITFDDAIDIDFAIIYYAFSISPAAAKMACRQPHIRRPRYRAKSKRVFISASW